MSYQVVALRWRPQTFEDLVGQEHVSRTLANAIRTNRVAHAFLFTGLRGVGKTTAARILAKALNCEKGPTPTPCNECGNCKEITAGSAVDVLEIDGASNTGVDDVRQIIENVRYSPSKSRYKIYIIDEVHMLSNSAFNALLKTLEEPPAHVKFIFATTDPHKLPATVQSRCQQYDFRRIPLRLVVERLQKITEDAKVSLSPESLFVLAREGEGSMRDAQSLLDQVLAGGGEQITDEEVLATLGIADRKLVYEIGDSMVRRDPARALELADSVHQKGYDLRRLTRDLVEHFRNVAVAQVTQSSLLPELPDEEQRMVLDQASRMPRTDCDRAFKILHDADEEIARSSHPKFVLEMALIRIATLPPVLPIDDLLARLDEIDGRPAGGGRTAAPTVKRPAAVPAAVGVRVVDSQPSASKPARPIPETRPAATNETFEWSEFVAYVTRARSSLGHNLSTCAPGSISADAVEIQAPRGFLFEYWNRRDHLDELEALAATYVGRAIRISVATLEPAKTSEVAEKKGPSRAELAEAALGDPKVRAAMQILGGEVLDVKQRAKRRTEQE